MKSVVGRFLEHSRIYYFHNQGTPDIYGGSADPMPRNIDRRVEVLFPIEDAAERQQVITSLAIYLHDTAKSHILRSDGRYESALQALEEGEEPFNSQMWLLHGRQSGKAPGFDANILPPTPVESSEKKQKEAKGKPEKEK